MPVRLEKVGFRRRGWTVVESRGWIRFRLQRLVRGDSQTDVG